MGRWGDAADKAAGPSDYLKLQDGTSTRFRVLTDPVVQNKTFDSDPDNPRTIFSWVVWDYDSQSTKILSKGATFIRKLDFFSETWGDEMPMACDVIVKTEGTRLNTTYDFSAVPPTVPLPPDWEAQVARLDLNKLVPNHIPIAKWSSGTNPPLDKPENEDIMSTHTRETSLPKTDGAVDNPPAVPDVVIEDIGDEPINLDDIPF